MFCLFHTHAEVKMTDKDHKNNKILIFLKNSFFISVFFFK